MAVNSVVEVGWKYGIVKAVTWKLLPILKNMALFQSFKSLNYYIIEKKFEKIWDQHKKYHNLILSTFPWISTVFQMNAI